MYLISTCINHPNPKNKKNIIQYEKPISFDFTRIEKSPPKTIPGMNSVSPCGDIINGLATKSPVL